MPMHRNANPGLHVHYTLGVLETGFTQAQPDVLNNARANGVRVDLVNIMAMDYGHAVPDMYAAAVSAAQGARGQLNSLGFSSTKLGITPMIGVNDSGGGAASPSCSGVSQSNFQFSSIFHGFAP